MAIKNLGTLVGRALARGGMATRLEAKIKRIEFKTIYDHLTSTEKYKDVDYGDMRQLVGKDLLSRQNAYGGRSPIGHALKGVETTGRVVRDIHDAIRSRSMDHHNYVPAGRPSAEVGNFKITPESRNTARITTGDDRRERRGKYEWERVGTQRKLALAGIAAATAGAVTGHRFLLKQGGNDVRTGIKNVLGKIKNKAKNIAGGIKAGATNDKTWKPKSFRPTDPDLRKKGTYLLNEPEPVVADKPKSKYQLNKERKAAKKAAENVVDSGLGKKTA